jgi:hypothetical protein
VFSIIDGLMSMKLDVYRQEEEQDPNTGAMVKRFMFYKTLDCYARGVIQENVNRNIDKQTFGNTYVNSQALEVRTLERLSQREKVKDIRDSNSNIIWYELNYPNNTGTVFEVIGSTPITDPFGTVVGYNTSLKRSENQQIGF